MRRVRLGMVGGGQGAFIGAVHRIAARIDDRYQLVAGALSSDPDRAAASAAELGIDPSRSYNSFAEMAKAEAARPDGIEAVSIVTPNHLHADAAVAFLEAGIHVICDKPLSVSHAEGLRIKQSLQQSSAQFFLTHNYTGYPLIREARDMISTGKLGKIRVVQAEYAQDWLAEPLETTGQKQASWRTDPKATGGGGAIGDIGTHAYNLVQYITGLEAQELAADLTSFVPGRAVDDNAHIWLRFKGGAKGQLWVSQVAVGNENALRLRIYGDKGGLEWEQENPNILWFTLLGGLRQRVTRGSGELSEAATAATRIPAGHPEGYLEAFATLYSDVADVLIQNKSADHLPNIVDGLDGMWFIEACIASSKNNGAWCDRNL
ncbi:MAG: Gfo/Idh/MocA family protein [Paracoccaceae bacterium]